MFKDPQKALELFVHKVEEVKHENIKLRIENQELKRILQEHGIDYQNRLSNIDYGFPGNGIKGH